MAAIRKTELKVREVDGSPAVLGVEEIILPNGAVTDDGNGSVAITFPANGVTEVDTGTGLTGGPITGTGTVALADTAVAPGTYPNAQVTVDQQGRIVAASAGSALPASQGDYLVSGGGIHWSSGYTYDIAPASYVINGLAYTYAGGSVTLGAADATHDRIDTLALTTSGTAVVIAGSPAVDPSLPDVDPNTQLFLTFVLVEATTTQPSTVTTTLVYAENVGTPTEWATSVSGGTINAASTSNPHGGTKDIEATSAANGAWVQLAAASPIDPSVDSALTLWVRSKGSWGNKTLRLAFQLSGTVKGTAVSLATGQFGFNASTTGVYQQVTIPLSLFSIPAGTLVNQLRITVSGGGASIGWYLDDIVLQGAVQQNTGSGLSQAQADARYAQRTLNLSDLTSAIAARVNLGLGSAAVHPAGDFAPVVHTHNATDIVAGTMAPDRLATGTRDGTHFLRDDGTWVTPPTSGGTVTSVTGTAPVAVATGTSTPVVSMHVADVSHDGYLNQTDWSAFSAKLDTTSGDARYLQRANNFSDLGSAITARANLGLGSAATHAATDFPLLVAGLVPAADLGTGTPSGTNFLRGDGVWAVPSGTGMSNPMTTAGDLITGGSGGSAQRLGVGANGTILTVAAGVPGWSAAPASGNAISTAAYASRPAAGTAGNLFLPSDGFVEERDTGSAWAPWGPVFPLTHPVLANYAWVNQGSATGTEAGGAICLKSTNSAVGWNVSMLKKAAPSTPYTITAGFIPLMYPATWNGVGIGWRDSGTGKMVHLQLFNNNTTSDKGSLWLTQWTDANTFSTSYFSSLEVAFFGPLVWFRIADDGTNRISSISADGQNFMQMHTVARTNVLANPNEVGFAAMVQGTANPFAMMTLVSWKEA